MSIIYNTTEWETTEVTLMRNEEKNRYQIIIDEIVFDCLASIQYIGMHTTAIVYCNSDQNYYYLEIKYTKGLCNVKQTSVSVKEANKAIRQLTTK